MSAMKIVEYYYRLKLWISTANVFYRDQIVKSTKLRVAPHTSNGHWIYSDGYQMKISNLNDVKRFKHNASRHRQLPNMYGERKMLWKITLASHSDLLPLTFCLVQHSHQCNLKSYAIDCVVADYILNEWVYCVDRNAVHAFLFEWSSIRSKAAQTLLRCSASTHQIGIMR